MMEACGLDWSQIAQLQHDSVWLAALYHQDMTTNATQRPLRVIYHIPSASAQITRLPLHFHTQTWR